MSSRVLLISIQPQWVRDILMGRKTVELRKTLPKTPWPVKALIYESSPACRLRAWCAMGPATADGPSGLWEKVKDRACIARADYDGYFAGKNVAYAIEVRDVRELASPVSLDRLRRDAGLSAPPQSFMWAPQKLLDLLDGVER